MRTLRQALWGFPRGLSFNLPFVSVGTEAQGQGTPPTVDPSAAEGRGEEAMEAAGQPEERRAAYRLVSKVPQARLAPPSRSPARRPLPSALPQHRQLSQLLPPTPAGTHGRPRRQQTEVGDLVSSLPPPTPVLGACQAHGRHQVLRSAYCRSARNPLGPEGGRGRGTGMRDEVHVSSYLASGRGGARKSRQPSPSPPS